MDPDPEIRVALPGASMRERVSMLDYGTRGHGWITDEPQLAILRFCYSQ